MQERALYWKTLLAGGTIENPPLCFLIILIVFPRAEISYLVVLESSLVALSFCSSSTPPKVYAAIVNWSTLRDNDCSISPFQNMENFYTAKGRSLVTLTKYEER